MLETRLEKLFSVAKSTERFGSLVRTGDIVGKDEIARALSTKVKKRMKGATLSTRVCNENMSKSYGL